MLIRNFVNEFSIFTIATELQQISTMYMQVDKWTEVQILVLPLTLI